MTPEGRHFTAGFKYIANAAVEWQVGQQWKMMIEVCKRLDRITELIEEMKDAQPTD